MAHPLSASGAMRLHGWLKKRWLPLSCRCPTLCPALILTQPGLSGLESFNNYFYASCQSCCPLRRVPSLVPLAASSPQPLRLPLSAEAECATHSTETLLTLNAA